MDDQQFEKIVKKYIKALKSRKNRAELKKLQSRDGGRSIINIDKETQMIFAPDMPKKKQYWLHVPQFGMCFQSELEAAI